MSAARSLTEAEAGGILDARFTLLLRFDGTAPERENAINAILYSGHLEPSMLIYF